MYGPNRGVGSSGIVVVSCPLPRETPRPPVFNLSRDQRKVYEMSAVELLSQIRLKWITRVSQELARGEGVRESFSAQLNRFYDLLIQAVELGNPEWLAPLLDEWAEARTESDISQKEASLHPILNQILLITYQVSREELSPEHSLELIGSLLPVYGYALQHVFTKEAELYIAYYSAELERAQASMERLDKSKSDFIAVAAHELKTPLTLIEGYASMLREVLPIVDGKTQSALYLKGIGQGTVRLREIVDDMIDVSLIDNNMLSLNFQPVWLNRLFKIVAGDVAGSASERSLALEIKPFQGSDEMTFGDPERLYQALRNVISNSIKYTPDGGRVTVDGRKLPGFIEVIVSDTGIGIDPEDHDHIFEKFGRLGNVSLHSSGKIKFKGGGPGLGLSIAKGIIEAHGGAIWVESPGYDEKACPGSTFHILLPIRRKPPDEKIAKLYEPLVTINRPELASYSQTTERIL
jgi:signal transduction histidine kinase